MSQKFAMPDALAEEVLISPSLNRSMCISTSLDINRLFISLVRLIVPLVSWSTERGGIND